MDYVLLNGPENHSAAFLMPDEQTVAQNQPFTRLTAGEAATSLAVFVDEDIYGEGIGGAHGGSTTRVALAVNVFVCP